MSKTCVLARAPPRTRDTKPGIMELSIMYTALVDGYSVQSIVYSIVYSKSVKQPLHVEPVSQPENGLVDD